MNATKHGPTIWIHTVHPWTHSGSVVYAAGHGGGMVCIIAEPEARFSSDAKQVEVGSRRWNEAMANARLIAAAPEMLEALEGLRMGANCFDHCYEIGLQNHSPACAKARAAIAKAEGS